MGFDTTNAINMVVNFHEKTDVIIIFGAPHPYFGRGSCQYSRCGIARNSCAGIKTNSDPHISVNGIIVAKPKNSALVNRAHCSSLSYECSRWI